MCACKCCEPKEGSSLGRGLTQGIPQQGIPQAGPLAKLLLLLAKQRVRLCAPGATKRAPPLLAARAMPLALRAFLHQGALLRSSRSAALLQQPSGCRCFAQAF